MSMLTRDDLYSLEQYAQMRPQFRARVMEHKKSRRVPMGPNASLYFEDRLTIQYQVQEMLRIERLFEAAEIAAELAAYTPLIPDGSNWKATFMLEYPDAEERRLWLAKLKGIERQTWVRVAGFPELYPIVNEDLPRETEEKTASVHFLRFELTPGMAAAVKAGASIAMGIEHPDYHHQIAAVEPAVRDALAADLA